MIMSKKVNAPPPSPYPESVGLTPPTVRTKRQHKSEPENVDPLLYFDPWCDPDKPRTIYYNDVVKAHRVIKDKIPTTPLTKANDAANFRINLHFKWEIGHKTGSFHERSAIYVLHKLKKDQRRNGLFTASLGNWAMALSYHAQKMNVPVTAYLPVAHHPNPYYLQYGATIIKAGKTMTESRKLAIQKMKQTTGAKDCYINGYDHPHVIAGAGTIAIEILEQLPNVDAILVPIGGGGLIAGIAAVVKKLKPDTLIYGMEPYRQCCFYKALDNEGPYTTEGAHCSVTTAGYNAFHTARSLIDKVILVNDDCIARAISHFVEEERLIVEHRSATALAVLFSEPKCVPELQDKNVVCVVTGGTIEYSSFQRALGRAKALDGRTMSIDIALPVGRTDEYEKVFKLLASLRCSIVQHNMEHQWFKSDDKGFLHVIMVCETRGPQHTCVVRFVLENTYPGLVTFSDDIYCKYIDVCPCYPKLRFF